MAITKVTKVGRIEVYPPIDITASATKMDAHERVMVVYEDVLDDESDTDLPVTATRVKHITKLVADDGAETDYSKEHALVKTVCAAIWA
tara:strand:- start:259 stop:525 length:267 start_codon:yes stop_codon:yes gene_type:complete